MKLTLFGKIAIIISISLLIYILMKEHAIIGYITFATILFILAVDKSIKGK